MMPKPKYERKYAMEIRIVSADAIGQNIMEEYEKLSCSKIGVKNEDSRSSEHICRLFIYSCSPGQLQELAYSHGSGIAIFLIILPFGGKYASEDYDTRGRHILFVTEKSCKNETEYYRKCIRKAARLFCDLKRLCSNNNAMDFISFDDLDLNMSINSYTDERHQLFFLNEKGSMEDCVRKIRAALLSCGRQTSGVFKCYLPENTTISAVDMLHNLSEYITQTCMGITRSDETNAEILLLGVHRQDDR